MSYDGLFDNVVADHRPHFVVVVDKNVELARYTANTYGDAMRLVIQAEQQWNSANSAIEVKLYDSRVFSDT